MEQINKNLAEIRNEFYRNQRFIGDGYHGPPIFELKGYDNEPNTPPRHEDKPDPEPETQEPKMEQEHKQLETPNPAAAETTRTPEPEPPGPPPAPQTTTKVPRALSRLSSDLNGINWNCEPLPGHRRYVVSKLDLYQTPGIHQGSYENTELVPDHETGPQAMEETGPPPDEEAGPPPKDAENPGQTER